MAPESKTKVIVIGAGPAGITAAYQLAKTGVAVEVFESTDAPGGMAKSISLWGQTVDLGPHRFFSSNRRVNELWLEIMGRDYAMVNRRTRIFYQNRFFSYPLRPFETFLRLGAWESILCAASYAYERVFPDKTPANSFECWVTQRFGKRLFEIFFRPYSEKLWGIHCDQLDADFAAQRIKKLSFWEVVKNAFTGGRKNKHKSLVDSFAYPLQGSGILYERMAKFVAEAPGCRVHYGVKVESVGMKGTKVNSVHLTDGTMHECDYVVSTMPLTHLVNTLPKAPAAVTMASRALTFRNTILVYVRVEGKNPFTDQWLYIQSPEYRMGRVTNFRNWVPSLNGDSKDTIIAVEYWCNDPDKIWHDQDEDIAALAARELVQTGLLKSQRILDTKVIRVPRCYPVYRRGYKEHLKVVTDYLDTLQGLFVIGRYGAFKYNNQDHSIFMGLLAADAIAEASSTKKSDLWKINTDYDTYQEESRITETGLSKVA